MTKKLNYVETYNNYTRYLENEEQNHDSAMQKAIGGEFDAIGLLEKDLLIQHGLNESCYLIDVGCGSGRLAIPLSRYFPNQKYLGTDIVVSLLNYARNKTNRDTYRYELIDSINIPESDNKADMICFFSVFTHLLYEETYNYLIKAKNVLKQGGKIVFSFLDFAVPPHWTVFENDYVALGDEKPLNMFLSKDAICAFADHLHLEIEALYRGDENYIKLTEPVRFENGSVAEKYASLGQSVCVLKKR